MLWHPGTMMVLLAAWVCIAWPARAVAQGGELVELDPRLNLSEAKPGVVYVTSSEVRGLTAAGDPDERRLKYAWSVPAGFEKRGPGEAGRDVVIVLHEAGRTHMWAHRALAGVEGAAGGAEDGAGSAGVFRPGDIVIAPEGVRPAEDGGRTWGDDVTDVGLVRDLALEITRVFPARRIVLFGHGQGGVCALAAGCGFPRLYAGVVVSGGGLSKALKLGPAQRGVPVALLHGSEDEVAPLRWAIDARDILVQEQFRIVSLVRVYGMRHAPEPAKADAAVSWLLAMTTTEPEEAMKLARGLLPSERGGAERGGAERGALGGAGFGLAARVLGRFELGAERQSWPRGFEKGADEHKAAARELMVKVEGLGLRHCAALRDEVPTGAALEAWRLSTDGAEPTWLGHLLALREDFRGVGPVEAFVGEVGFDAVQGRQDAGSRGMIEEFARAQRLEAVRNGRAEIRDEDEVLVSSAQAFERVVTKLGGAGADGAALFEGLPCELFAQMSAWHEDAQGQKLRAEDAARFGVVRAWQRGVLSGRERYERINAGW